MMLPTLHLSALLLLGSVAHGADVPGGAAPVARVCQRVELPASANTAVIDWTLERIEVFACGMPKATATHSGCTGVLSKQDVALLTASEQRSDLLAGGRVVLLVDSPKKTLRLRH